MIEEHRARAINRAIVQVGMLSVLGWDEAKPDVALLRECSLREMLDAVDFVRLDNETKPATNGTRSLSLVPDERLTAAVYTLLHFPLDRDDDDLIVGLPEGGRIHLLITATRDRSAIEPEADDDEEQAA